MTFICTTCTEHSANWHKPQHQLLARCHKQSYGTFATSGAGAEQQHQCYKPIELGSELCSPPQKKKDAMHVPKLNYTFFSHYTIGVEIYNRRRKWHIWPHTPFDEIGEK